MVEPQKPRSSRQLSHIRSHTMASKKMPARQRGWIGDFRNQQASVFRSRGLYSPRVNAYKMVTAELYG
jgi:hypothetical protein